MKETLQLGSKHPTCTNSFSEIQNPQDIQKVLVTGRLDGISCDNSWKYCMLLGLNQQAFVTTFKLQHKLLSRYTLGIRSPSCPYTVVCPFWRFMCSNYVFFYLYTYVKC